MSFPSLQLLSSSGHPMTITIMTYVLYIVYHVQQSCADWGCVYLDLRFGLTKNKQKGLAPLSRNVLIFGWLVKEVEHCRRNVNDCQISANPELNLRREKLNDHLPTSHGTCRSIHPIRSSFPYHCFLICYSVFFFSPFCSVFCSLHFSALSFQSNVMNIEFLLKICRQM